MSIAITIDLPVDPERTDEFLALVKETTPDTRAYDGCEQLTSIPTKTAPAGFSSTSAGPLGHSKRRTWPGAPKPGYSRP